MPSFVWKGKNRFGAFQEGILIADTRDAAIAILRRQNVQVTSIREKGRELRLLPKFPRGVSAKRVAIFTRQFSVMLDAGLPLVQCLEILGEQEEHRTFREIIQPGADRRRVGLLARRLRCASTRRPSTTSTSR